MALSPGRRRGRRREPHDQLPRAGRPRFLERGAVAHGANRAARERRRRRRGRLRHRSLCERREASRLELRKGACVAQEAGDHAVAAEHFRAAASILERLAAVAHAHWCGRNGRSEAIATRPTRRTGNSGCAERGRGPSRGRCHVRARRAPVRDDRRAEVADGGAARGAPEGHGPGRSGAGPGGGGARARWRCSARGVRDPSRSRRVPSMTYVIAEPVYRPEGPVVRGGMPGRLHPPDLRG